MEWGVRRPVSAIWADACGESTDSSDKYQPGGRTSARPHNTTAVSHPQGCPDQHAHGAGNRVPRALGLRTASDSPDDCRKEALAGTPGDTYNANGQTDAHCTDDPHSDHGHCDHARNASG